MTAPRPRIPMCRDCANAKRTLRYRRRPLLTRTEAWPRRQRHYIEGAPICGRDGIRWDET